jgi:hypothetical protein
MLQNTGLTLLRTFNFDERRKDLAWARTTYRHSDELRRLLLLLRVSPSLELDDVAP